MARRVSAISLGPLSSTCVCDKYLKQMRPHKSAALKRAHAYISQTCQQVIQKTHYILYATKIFILAPTTSTTFYPFFQHFRLTVKYQNSAFFMFWLKTTHFTIPLSVQSASNLFKLATHSVARFVSDTTYY